MATAATLATNGSAITFNPAWLSTGTINNYGLKATSGTITNHIIIGEILDVSRICLALTLDCSILGQMNINSVV